MSPNIRVAIEILDSQSVQVGGHSYSQLESELVRACDSGDLVKEGDTALEMALRVSSVAKLISTLAARQANLPGMPTVAETLECAIPLFEQAVKRFAGSGEQGRECLARTRLAETYMHSRQFETALQLFLEAQDRFPKPADAAMTFNVAQKIGDCYIELENDAAALSAYERGLEIARLIDDPFEIHVQHGKIAGALGNLKRYDECLAHFSESRKILVRIAASTDLQGRISVHRNMFNVEAIPRLIDYTDKRTAHILSGLGRDLLLELPARLAGICSAALTAKPVPALSGWPVYRELNQAVRSAVAVLRSMLNLPLGAKGDDEAVESTLKLVGEFARHAVDPTAKNPDSLVCAARFVMQVDRSRRAALHLRNAQTSVAKPGPFGGCTSSHALYLRSFAASPHLPRVIVEPWGLLDLEELLACRFDESPLIALGDPELERFGPGRSTTTDENWRDALRALGMEASLIIVIPTLTKGTSWEIEWVTTNKLLHKTCFLMPPAGPSEGAWWVDNWRELRDWAVRFGINLPPYTQTGSVFRLTSEGLVDQIDFSVIYGGSDLKMPLKHKLLFRTNLSWDFGYAIQQYLDSKQNQFIPETGLVNGKTSEGVHGNLTLEELEILDALEVSSRMEMSNWFFDAPQIPKEPGILMYFESPFQVLWAEVVDDLHETLLSHANGLVSNFTRRMFQQKVLDHLTPSQLDQLIAKTLTIESIMSFKVKQVVSYKFVVTKNPESRTRVANAVLAGITKHGVPEFALTDRQDRTDR